MRFAKYHGLGNDFVLLDLRDGSRQVDAARARELCDRHRGIGADGVLSLFPSDKADARLHIFNADGSEPESCGNGIRCAAQELIPRAPDGGLGEGTVRLETPAGIVECRGQGGEISVDMGRAIVGVVDAPVVVDGRELRLTTVSMGNPHAVVFEGGEELCRRLGPLLEVHPLFPLRTNVEFAQVRSPDAIELWVWERGAGFTEACGTGACAAAAAAVHLGRAQRGREIAVTLPGGVLHVTMEESGRVLMRGPAVKVYEGNVCGRKKGRA